MDPHILNYIERFHYKSGKYIDFYLPGYLEENSWGYQGKITIKGKEYFFNSQMYDEYLQKLENDFAV